MLEQLPPPDGGRIRLMHQLRKAEFQGGERLAGRVMQITSDSPALLVLKAHQFADNT